MSHYGHSPWVHRFPAARVPLYPRQRGQMAIDVLIVGGGLTGCATAYAFAAHGVKVALVEAARIGRGSSGSAAGWIADDPGIRLSNVEKARGAAAARIAGRAWRRAALDFAALLRRLGVKCNLEPRSTLFVATTPEQAAQVKREQNVRRSAGLDAPLITPAAIASEVGLAASAALRARDGATIDPYRASLGLAAAAAARGARLFERTAVKKITFGRKDATVQTKEGTIRTRQVVVATGLPTPLFAPLARHFWFKTAYLALTQPVPAKIRHQLGRRTTVVRDCAEPPHIVRWVDDERLLVAGADRESPPGPLRGKAIVQRTGQLMYELSTLYPDISGIRPEYGWDAPYVRTADGLPYIGPHRNYPHHLFALGDASHSVTGAYLASRIMLRHYLDQADPADEAFAFTR